MPHPDVSNLVALVRHPSGDVEELPAHRLEELDQLLTTDSVMIWVSAVVPDEQQIESLRREFQLHPLAVEDVRKQGSSWRWPSSWRSRSSVAKGGSEHWSAHAVQSTRRMSIQQPPNDEIPPMPPEDDGDRPQPIDTPDEPEQRAPGADQSPVGAPRDEPDLELA